MVVSDVGPGPGVVIGLLGAGKHVVTEPRRKQRLTIKFQMSSAASIFEKSMCLYWLVTALVAAWKDVIRLVLPRQSEWRSTHRDEVGRGIALRLLQAVKRCPELRDQGRQARTFGVGVGELEVDVNTI